MQPCQTFIEVPSAAQIRLPRAAAGAASSFADAVSGQRPYLLRFARSRLRDDALAEDIVQETLLAALQGKAPFERRAALRTWLTGILLRRIADHSRRHQRNASRAGDASPASPTSVGGVPAAAAGDTGFEPIDWIDPQRRLESRQALQALDEGMAALPALAARVFALREFEGLSNEQVADELGLSPNRSAVLLHRARLRLRNGLLRSWHPTTPGMRIA